MDWNAAETVAAESGWVPARRALIGCKKKAARRGCGQAHWAVVTARQQSWVQPPGAPITGWLDSGVADSWQ